MQIDRASFVMLTAAIAAASCVVVEEKKEPTTAQPASDAGSDATVARDGGGGGGDGGSPDGGDGGSPDGGGGGSPDGGDGGSVVACNDDVLDADAGDAGMTCPMAEGATDIGCFTPAECQTKDALKARPWDTFWRCLARASTCFSEGGPSARETCAAEVIAAACPDPAAATACATARATCGASADAGALLADCEKLLAPVTEGARATFVTCITEIGCEPGTWRDYCAPF